MLFGCSYQIPELKQAGYYSSTEKNIRISCEREVYGAGVPIGNHTVYSYNERLQVVDKILKSNPQVRSAATKVYSKGKNVVVRNDIAVGGNIVKDIQRLDKKIEDCGLSKGSKYREKLSSIIRKK